MKTLPISKDLNLPLDAVTQKFAFLARTGAGKTYAAMKLCELMLDADAQILALDPVGVWYGLRLAADGKGNGFAIPVFGGDHGDVPLEPTSGALIADLVVDRHLSAVLDVSMFESKRDHKRFAADFATRLFFRKKAARSPVHLFLEEAQEFVPQFSKGEEVMLGAFERLIKLGRNYGIGASLISQRPQAVNKDVLNQTECLFALQTTGPHERKAIADWIKEKGLNDDIAELLPKLAVGEARVWSPQWLGISKTVRISQKRTFDASATPVLGAAQVKPKMLTPVDVEEIRKAMSEQITRAEENDPAKLKQEIARLRKQLAEQQPEKIVEQVNVLMEEDRQWLAGIIKEARGYTDEFENHISQAAELVAPMQQFAETIDRKMLDIEQRIKPSTSNQPEIARHRTIPARQQQTVPTQTVKRAAQSAASEPSSLRAGERRMVQVLAQFVHLGGLTRDQLALLSGYTRSGTFDAYVGTLVRLGFAEKTSKGLSVTEAGLNTLGSDQLPAPSTTEELVALFSSRLRAGERLMLDLLVERYPDAMTRDDLAGLSGYARSGTFDAYVGTLARQHLVTKQGGLLRASDTLFLS